MREVASVPVVRVAAWEQYGWLRHGFSTRTGGVTSVYGPEEGPGELNLGWTKEDEAAHVVENRRRFVEAVGGGELVGVRQVHSAVIQGVGRREQGVGEATANTLADALRTVEGKPVLEGDGLMTDVPGIVLGVGVADCVPVLVVDVRRRVVAVFHAGWRGTVAGIVESGVGRMLTEYGSRAEDLVAAVGPSIGACCYGVGDEVRQAFSMRFGYGPELFREMVRGTMHLDLWEANRRQLVGAGVAEERIAVVGECTACTRVEGRRKYFSHRAEGGVAGRMMGVVGVAVVADGY